MADDKDDVGTLALQSGLQPIPEKPATLPPIGGPPPSYIQPPTEAQEKAATEQTARAIQQKLDSDNALLGAANSAEAQYKKEFAEHRQATAALKSQMQPWNAQAELQKREIPIWEQFGSPAFVISMIASAFSAKPMNAALMSGGAAMKAMNDGRMEDYRHSFDAWKENTELTMKRINMEHTDWEEVLGLMDKNVQMARLRAEAAAGKYADTRAQALIRNGMFQELADSKRSIALANEQMSNSYWTILQNEQKRKFFESTTEAQNGDLRGASARLTEYEIVMGGVKTEPLREKKATADKLVQDISKDPSIFYSLTSDAQLRTRALIAAFHPEFDIPEQPHLTSDQPPPNWSQSAWDSAADLNAIDPNLVPRWGWGKQAADIRQRLEAYTLERHPDAGQLAINKATYKAESTALGKLVTQAHALSAFEETALRNGKVVVALGDKVDRTGVPVIERWLRAGRQASGDPDVNNFNFQLTSFRNEVGRIMTNPNLAGVLTNYTKKEAQSLIDGNITKRQLGTLIRLIESDFNNRKEPLQNEINAAKAALSGKIYSTPPRPPTYVPGTEAPDRSAIQFEWTE